MPSSSGSEGRVLERSEDIDALLSGYRDLHPQPFHSTSRRRVEGYANQLKERVGRLGEDEFLVSMMRLVGLLGRERDGHMIFTIRDDDDVDVAPIWPLSLYRFADGLFVVDAFPSHAGLIGQKVVAVGGTPWREAWRQLARLTARDNVMTELERVPAMFVMPRVLHGLGLAGPDGGPLTLVAPSGKRHDVTLDPVSTWEFTAEFDVWGPAAQGVPPSDETLALRRQDDYLWMRVLPGKDAIYVGYNAVMDVTIEAADRLSRLLRTHEGARVIVDLRNNSGGDNTTYSSLVSVLRRVKPGALYFLTSHSTFSAAMTFLMEIYRTNPITIVGEAPGGAPSFFSDSKPVYLSSAGASVEIPLLRWNTGHVSLDEFPGNVVKPDIPIEYTSRDWRRGRDPALAAALAR